MEGNYEADRIIGDMGLSIVQGVMQTFVGTTSVPEIMQLWVACHVKWLTFDQVSSK
jgi:hypothetical protein